MWLTSGARAVEVLIEVLIEETKIGDLDNDNDSDVNSLGCILHHM
jgi:hypothetical protein